MRLWRYCFAGLLFNWLGFVFWTVVPIAAEKFHPSSTQLALLQTSSSVVYVLTSLITGGLSDRVSRSTLARLGVIGGIAACVAVVYINNLSLLYLAAPLMGLGGSIFWPSIQGAVGAESEPARVERSIGWFNVSWSVGKTLGFVIAGWLAQRHGQGFVLWIAVAAAAPILFFYPGNRKLHAPEALETGRSDTAVFRTMGYIANFMAFGAGNVFSNQFYKYAEQMKLGGGHTATLFGLVLGAMYGTQTILFLVLQRGSSWAYRRGLLYGTQLLAAAGAVSVTFFTSEPALLGAAALVGIGLGFVNASSIYYSLHGPANHGKYAGLHEAVLGAGSCLLPLAGGKLNDLNKDLRMAYWLAGALTVMALAIQEIVYRKRPRS